MNLNELLSNIDQLAEDGLQLPDACNEALKDKIDAYYFALKSLDAISESLSQEIDKVRAKKKNVENNIERMRDYLLFNMKHFGWAEIKGNAHKAKIVTRKTFVVKHDPQMYIDHEFVDEIKTYKFNLEKLKELVERDPKTYEELATWEQKESVRLT